MQNDEQSPKDEGSVWTSYSDLFTNVAIIFLVMFVFALLKSGISKVETAALKKKHESELRAKLTAQDLKRSETKIKQVEKSLSEMSHVEKLIDEKVKEMETFAQKLQKNKEVLHELIDEQKKKDSILTIVNEKLEIKEKEIVDLNQVTKQLQEKISSVENQKQEKDRKIRELESSHLVTVNQLEQDKNDLEYKINQTKTEIARLHGEKRDLEQMTQNSNAIKSKLEQELSQLQAKNQEMEEESKTLKGSLSGLSEDNAQLKNDIEKLNRNIQGQMAEIEKYKNLQASSANKVASLESDLNRSNQQMKNLGKIFQEMKDKLRASVADNLKKKFAENNLPVDINGKTGNVVLLMDQNFLFKRNSAELSKKAKETLTKVVPLYSEVIFGDHHIAGKIEAINITGHASPSYNRQYVNPLDDSHKAYAHNLSLSAMRAVAITNFMMGKEIGQYAHKATLKKHVHAIGRGYIEPVLKDKEQISVPRRGLASVAEQDCGPYDCSRSQRVEIGFSLKEDAKVMEKIIQMSGERQ